MDGLLLVDKPIGWTSFDVVAKVRGLLKAETKHKIKVGHTGTLDPMASGLLILLIGSYTKRAEILTKLDKVYEACLYLGKTSTTGDAEGEITDFSSHKPSVSEIKLSISKFSGNIQQVPPAYSAIKVDGQRAYKLIRKGIVPELQARSVHIYSLIIKNYSYPELRIVTRVSSGTYVRSLAADIGQSLNVGAYLSQLIRLKVGDFDLSQAQALNNLSAEQIYSNLRV